jgi:hypothetical protein
MLRMLPLLPMLRIEPKLPKLRMEAALAMLGTLSHPTNSLWNGAENRGVTRAS